MLDARLKAVAHYIHGPVHADIGSDHALLPMFLLNRSQLTKVIVVEKHRAPFERSVLALQSYIESHKAEVRLGDGLAPIGVAEVESASMSGMGAKTILKILEADPNRVPPTLILQPNKGAEQLRAWALEQGFHLKAESLVKGFWPYVVLQLQRGHGLDAAYDGVDLALGIAYGPQLLKEKHPLLVKHLVAEKTHVKKLILKGVDVKSRLESLESALSFMGVD